MPETAAAAVERKRRARDADRRRRAVEALRLAESVAGYAAGQVGDGLGPDEARAAVVEAAGELAEASARLRTLARLGPADRRRLAAELANLGFTRTEIAVRLGVCDRAVRGYLAGGSTPSRS